MRTASGKQTRARNGLDAGAYRCAAAAVRNRQNQLRPSFPVLAGCHPARAYSNAGAPEWFGTKAPRHCWSGRTRKDKHDVAPEMGIDVPGDLSRGGAVWLHRDCGRKRRYRAHPLLYLCGDLSGLVGFGAYRFSSVISARTFRFGIRKHSPKPELCPRYRGGVRDCSQKIPSTLPFSALGGRVLHDEISLDCLSVRVL
jgi:hypothetical protein